MLGGVLVVLSVEATGGFSEQEKKEKIMMDVNKYRIVAIRLSMTISFYSIVSTS